MFRVIATKNGEQVQNIEYENLEYGILEMTRMYPDAEITHSDMQKEIDDAKIVSDENKAFVESLKKE